MKPPPQPCPVCRGDRLHGGRVHHAAGSEYTLYDCDRCGLQHWQPLQAPASTYYEDEKQAMYSSIHEGLRRIDGDPRYERFLGQFGSVRGKRLLDVGCADGALMDAFRERGNDVVGIDIDARSLARARSRGLEVHETTLEQFAGELAAGRRFDVVTLFDVLEHLTDPRRALEVARSLLAPGGRLVGTVPNRQRLFANLIDADFPPHHFLRFDERALGVTLREVGFEPEGIEVFQWGYAGPTLLNQLVRNAKRVVRSVGRTAAGPASGRSGGASARRGFKHDLAAVAFRSVAMASTPFERALGRGFKLFFVAGA